jgi:hypothetical protein
VTSATETSFQERRFSAGDGLQLYARDYGQDDPQTATAAIFIYWQRRSQLIPKIHAASLRSTIGGAGFRTGTLIKAGISCRWKRKTS